MPPTRAEAQIMGMASRVRTHDWVTAEQFLEMEFPHELMVELIGGVVVMTAGPSFRHGKAVAWLTRHLTGALDPLRYELFAHQPCELSDRDVFFPDLTVLPSLSASTLLPDLPPPLVAIEVLSPSTQQFDRGEKRIRYLESGVRDYWIVDVDAGVIERWQHDRSDVAFIRDTLTWSLPDGTTGSLDVAAMMAALQS
jgi:Uma2 family endonuclease